MTQRHALLAQVLALSVALLGAMAISSLLILLFGQASAHIYALMLEETLGSGSGIGQVLFKATPLLFSGLSVALAFRAGLFNIGAEGQIVLGAFAAAMTGIALPADTPSWLAVPLCGLAAFVGGALVGLIPGLLKAFTGAHEVINTLMLNFIVQAVLEHAGRHVFMPETMHTAQVIAGARLTPLAALIPPLRGSAASTAFFGALGAAALVWLFLFFTRPGFRLRALGLSPTAAECAGIRPKVAQALAMALAGGIAGLGGTASVLGHKGYYETGFSGGVGFMGIAVALLGKNHPFGIVAASLLFGFLSQAGLVINALVPKELVEVLQAIVIIALAAASPWAREVLERSLGRSGTAAHTAPSHDASAPSHAASGPTTGGRP